jgi:hypothetical protein
MAKTSLTNHNHPEYLPAPESWRIFFRDWATWRHQNHSMMRNPDDDADALWMRSQGKTFAVIGDVFGVSAGRARQIVEKVEQHARWGQGIIPRPNGLPVPPRDLFDLVAPGRPYPLC